MFKQIIFISSFVYFAGAMELAELHIIGPQDKDDNVSLSAAQRELTRSYEANQMGWVPAMYEVSGLAHCMSKESFMVNALREIKERIFNHENGIKALEVLQAPGKCCAEEPGQLMTWSGAANFWLSGAALGGAGIATWIMAPKYYAPDRTIDQCYFKSDSGYSMVHTFYWDSVANNKPCNFTQLGDWGTVGCSYALAYSICKKDGEKYNRTVYPKEMFKAFMPLIIAVPSIVTLQLLFQLAGYKYRRMKREAYAQIEEARHQQTSKGNV